MLRATICQQHLAINCFYNLFQIPIWVDILRLHVFTCRNHGTSTNFQISSLLSSSSWLPSTFPLIKPHYPFVRQPYTFQFRQQKLRVSNFTFGYSSLATAQNRLQKSHFNHLFSVYWKFLTVSFTISEKKNSLHSSCRKQFMLPIRE